MVKGGRKRSGAVDVVEGEVGVGVVGPDCRDGGVDCRLKCFEIVGCYVVRQGAEGGQLAFIIRGSCHFGDVEC